ncbi:hypothetical protein [Bartonella apihabitans]|uniref:hypothetical protein n=1 Tax=Bartonella apihabitans TaxID=2750929 RepID=UPI00098F6CD9|nr:hypothetical protein [Bartonella apihabitans]
MPEKQKPTRCASGSIVPNSSPRATPAITANITHAANAANITRAANIANIPNISRALNDANIAHIPNAAKFTPAAHKACLSFAPVFFALLPVLEALIANIANAAKFTPAAHKACLSFAPRFLALLPTLEALIANITNAAKFTPASHKACLSFDPRFSRSFARFGSSCPRKSVVSHIVPHPWQLLLFLKLRFQALKEKQNAIAIRCNLDTHGSFT